MFLVIVYDAHVVPILKYYTFIYCLFQYSTGSVGRDVSVYDCSSTNLGCDIQWYGRKQKWIYSSGMFLFILLNAVFIWMELIMYD